MRRYGLILTCYCVIEKHNKTASLLQIVNYAASNKTIIIMSAFITEAGNLLTKVATTVLYDQQYRVRGFDHFVKDIPLLISRHIICKTRGQWPY